MKSIDEMREELKEAGYREVEWSATYSAWRTPDGYDFEFAHASTPDILRVINFAYAHLQKERQFAVQAQEIAALQARVSEFEDATQCYRDDIKTMIDGANLGWTVDRLRRYAVEVMQGIVKREGE